MSMPSASRRSSSNTPSYKKSKLLTKHPLSNSGQQEKVNNNEHVNGAKPFDVTVSMLGDKKSDTSKSHRDTDKGCHDPCIGECRDFPGVTIIFRTAANPKAFAHLDSHGNRKRHDNQHSQNNGQDKYENDNDVDDTVGTSN